MTRRWFVGAWAASAVILLIVDQVTKTAAQFTLDGRRFEGAGGWGLTYIVNPGTWLLPEASWPVVAACQLAAVFVWAGWLVGTWWYARHYRRSAALDWAVGFMTLAVFGNLIDRLLVGGARDWAITPLATGNLADVAVWPALVLLGWEVWDFPPARRLLSWDPRRWRAPAPTDRADTFGPPAPGRAFRGATGDPDESDR